MNRGQRSAPITRYLALVIVGVVIVSIAVISSFAYLESRERLISTEYDHRNFTASSLVQNQQVMDHDLSIFDDLFTDRMQEAFPQLIAEYGRTGGDVASMDLAGVKAGLGDGYDLYVIDPDGMIAATTYLPELGFNLSSYPGFEATLTAMRLGDEFVADRVVQENVNGTYRKYAYHPTPDHRYLLEIGLKDEVFDRRSEIYSPLSLEQLQAANPSLMSVSVYNLLKHPIGSGRAVDDPLRTAALDQAIQTRSTVERADPANATLHHYLFVDLLDPRYASDPSLVIELVYSTSPLDQALLRLTFEYLMITFFAVALGVIVAVGISSRVSRPIRGIIADVEQIAGGDLDHPLTRIGLDEFDRLQRSIERMVGQLRAQIAAVRTSEQQVRQQNEALEHRVEERTRELSAANEEIRLYMDILTHDINNALTSALVLSESLAEEIEDGPRNRPSRIADAIRQSAGVIACVNRVEQLRHLDLPLEDVELDREIRTVLMQYPEISVEYTGTDAVVRGDGFLLEVLVNLLGNSAKFGGPGVRCWIRVEPEAEGVRVSVEDDGPGIPDPDKGRVFGRSTRCDRGLPGSGLGLFIAASLVHRYGGRIWVDDRVAGDPAQGAAFRFTLRRGDAPSAT